MFLHPHLILSVSEENQDYANFWELFFKTKFPGHIVARESHFFDQLLETRGGEGHLRGGRGDRDSQI